ncbi:MJ1255/VC2487 family glycosyltransferase [Marinibactrum halimedae]|uniref:Glycosyl transferase n=1 Tax=Marinibactrum halimedae TaxID=1444977 RepID=A0AA37T3W7_9GAMM|nr:MJ1255/VC2487 family glycosyltransferase [Marinibactrum halimedae]MCD9460097.1 glycosyltransferase [Marinibactrum halimedae]GLS26498.1 glycosyl transferase [Marinibactrum halimedae]
MKIFYGVQGTGNGHLTRARALQQAFAERTDAQVDYLFSGRARDDYFDMEQFGEWECRAGLTFYHQNGRIDFLKTIKNNKIRTFFRDISELDLSTYDIVLTDFEPVTAWAAKRSGKQVIGMGHQYAFDFAIPKRGNSIVAQSIMNQFAPVNFGLGLHWHHFGYPILPPIAETTTKEQPIQDNKIVVYLGFEDPDRVIQLLSPFTEYEFYFYGTFPEPKSLGNIHLRPLSRDGFKADLASGSGVICNAGFELASEAIELGKKLLVKPLHGQMEQLSNALALESLNLGKCMEKLDSHAVKDWLDNTQGIKVKYPNVAKAIVNWVLEGEWNERSRNQLAKTLWNQVESPHIEEFANIPLLEKALAMPAS